MFTSSWCLSSAARRTSIIMTIALIQVITVIVTTNNSNSSSSSSSSSSSNNTNNTNNVTTHIDPLGVQVPLLAVLLEAAGDVADGVAPGVAQHDL